jgi:hypothetical protein
MELIVEAEDLVKWARYFDQVPRRIKPAVAKAINYIGSTLVDQTAKFISDSTGLDEDAVRGMIRVSEATPNDWEWSMDASQVAPPSLDWSRPWDKPASSGGFDDNTLVKVVTMDDELVCQICQDAADDSPYTLTEAQAMLPLHKNCRCLMQAFYSMRRLPVTFAGPGVVPPQLLTIRQLGAAVAGELSIVLKAHD